MLRRCCGTVLLCVYYGVLCAVLWCECNFSFAFGPQRPCVCSDIGDKVAELSSNFISVWPSMKSFIFGIRRYSALACPFVFTKILSIFLIYIACAGRDFIYAVLLSGFYLLSVLKLS